MTSTMTAQNGSGKPRKRKAPREPDRAKPKKRRHDPEEMTKMAVSGDPKSEPAKRATKAEQKDVKEFGGLEVVPFLGLPERTTSTWRRSDPMGGRMANIDAVFSPDEE
jgi:hypothetical protein